MEKAAAPVRPEGFCGPDYVRVREAFEENFRSRGEVGAAVCVYAGGTKVVDLWGGYRDPQRRLPWAADTLVCMMSVAKGVVALAVLMLVDRGRIELEAPVARYWPGFARNGKQDITVHQLMAGLGGLVYVDHAPPGALLHWEQMIEGIERQAPEWPPGTRGAYHSITQGFLLGELVRRVDGRRVEVFIREEIAAPLGVEFIMSLRAGELERLADIIPNPGSVTGNAIRDPTTKLGRAWRVQPAVSGFFLNDPQVRGAVIPSANGHSNARSTRASLRRSPRAVSSTACACSRASSSTRRARPSGTTSAASRIGRFATAWGSS